MHNPTISVGIVGGSGYVAGELLRLLVHHPAVHIAFIYSHSEAGAQAADFHQDLWPYGDLPFSQVVDPEADVVFLCLGHGHSRTFLERQPLSPSTRVIDLGSDFRLQAEATFAERPFQYGLVEAFKTDIKSAQNISNPGCFATAIQLALLPLAHANLLTEPAHIHAITGATGAGRCLSDTSHFSWRNSNISIYKPFQHQHLAEIRQTLGLATTQVPPLHFLPVRGDFTRGIFASIYLPCGESETQLRDLYAGYYADAPFTHLFDGTVHLKQVVNTNHCFLQVQKIGDQVLITSVIDNLLKGAAGQAVHNLNLLFDLPEVTGLQLKSSYF